MAIASSPESPSEEGSKWSSLPVIFLMEGGNVGPIVPFSDRRVAFDRPELPVEVPAALFFRRREQQLLPKGQGARVEVPLLGTVEPQRVETYRILTPMRTVKPVCYLPSGLVILFHLTYTIRNPKCRGGSKTVIHDWIDCSFGNQFT
eukprot:gb/GECG01011063.1/.p1 GENE.gb/GECG01011063.1/~~gb/GECG01011063.1/.p1  ORF type:complete len:147 (+),score=6.73 gb/GECG01011063.1/:1-441(+)